jgi:hypothetical protein
MVSTGGRVRWANTGQERWDTENYMQTKVFCLCLLCFEKNNEKILYLILFCVGGA